MDTNGKIQLRHLGKTDILVTPVGLGVMEMAGGGGLIGHMFPVISQDDKNAIIKAALDGGIAPLDGRYSLIRPPERVSTTIIASTVSPAISSIDAMSR